MRLIFLVSLLLPYVSFSQISGTDNTKVLTEDQVKTIAAKTANYQVVACGEAAHGGEEFGEVKFALFKQLALHHDFRVFAIEGDYAAAQNINRYITTGEGNPTEEIKNLLPTAKWLYNTPDLL